MSSAGCGPTVDFKHHGRVGVGARLRNRKTYQAQDFLIRRTPASPSSAEPKSKGLRACERALAVALEEFATKQQYAANGQNGREAMADRGSWYGGEGRVEDELAVQSG
jgi:hypothetical protein